MSDCRTRDWLPVPETFLVNFPFGHGAALKEFFFFFLFVISGDIWPGSFKRIRHDRYKKFKIILILSPSYSHTQRPILFFD